MNRIKTVCDFEDRLNDLLDEYALDSFLFVPKCVDECIELMHIMFGDKDKDEWISYFIYEMEWGNRWTPGTIKDSDGSDIPLGSINDLWNLLTDTES